MSIANSTGELYEVSRGLSLAGFDLSRNVIDWANEKWMEKNRYARIMKSYEGLGMKRAVAWPIAKWQQYDCGTKVRKALDMAKRKWILVRKRYLSGLGFTSLSVPGTVVDGHISGSTTTDDPTISEQNQTANSSPIGDSDEEWEEI